VTNHGLCETELPKETNESVSGGEGAGREGGVPSPFSFKVNLTCIIIMNIVSVSVSVSVSEFSHDNRVLLCVETEVRFIMFCKVGSTQIPIH